MRYVPRPARHAESRVRAWIIRTRARVLPIRPPLSTSTLIVRAERQVGPVIADEVAAHIVLARGTTDAAGTLIEEIQHVAGEPRAIHACAFLLARLITDLRAVVHLVELGYVAPALSLTAGMLEMAHTSMYIGASEARAEKWLCHDDTKNAAPWGTYDIIQGVAGGIDVPEHIIRREWEVIYRTACMAKHGNPMALKQVGFVERGDQKFIIAGPYLSYEVNAWAHMALGYAIRYTKLASIKFLTDHIPASGRRDALYHEWKALGDQQQSLAASDVARLGNPSASSSDQS